MNDTQSMYFVLVQASVLEIRGFIGTVYSKGNTNYPAFTLSCVQHHNFQCEFVEVNSYSRMTHDYVVFVSNY